jgi:phenylpropionate dioxygenase-like ring-hydroxylating dioxygenase large terminal subunit
MLDTAHSVLGGDADLVARILRHIDDGTTDRGDRTWREPVENYRSAERLAEEIALIRAYPTVFCPSAAIPEPGSYVTRDAAGAPILAVRGEDGRARAFLNACRHRGATVASGHGCAKSFTCAYHGWIYRLDGSLAMVSHATGFPDLDRKTRGLVEVPADEHNGLVFVTVAPPGVEPFDAAAVPPIFPLDSKIVGSRALPIKANWKLVVESFLESYHTRFLHPETFYKYGFDNMFLADVFGRNCRLVAPFQRIESQRAAPEAERRIGGMATLLWFLFPNTIIAQQSHHTVVGVLEPVDLTNTLFVRYVLTNRTSDEGAQKADRDNRFTERGAIEDFDVVETIQHGLQTNANEALEFGLFEPLLAHVHANLDELLAARRAGGAAAG